MPTEAPIFYPAASSYTFGSTDEVGISVESYEQNSTCDVYEQKNGVGEVIEVVTFNPHDEITISGEMTSALGQILGRTLTVSNLLTLQSGAGGICIVKSVTQSKGRAKNMSVRISASYYPLVTA